MSKIKICGLFRKEDIVAVNTAKPDYIGFVFAESKRRVSAGQAAELRIHLSPGITPVGVFSDHTIYEIVSLVQRGIIAAAQLHGSEDEGYIRRLKTLCPIPVIKAIQVHSSADIRKWKDTQADFLLLDSGAGSGVPFDWNQIQMTGKRFFLAGGINESNLGAALSLHPYCVDLSSGAETNGLKDPGKSVRWSALSEAAMNHFRRGARHGIHFKTGRRKRSNRRIYAGWEDKGFSTIFSVGTEHKAVCLIGNTASVDLDHVVETSGIVEYGKRITEQYKAVNRSVHTDDTLIKIGDILIGEGTFTVISGPCSVESEEQIVQIARSVKNSGAKILRGGAFKPRTSPYSFQGMQADGIKLLLLAKQETGLPIVSEIMNQTQERYFEDVDIIQIGARNMQNFDLLKAVGRMKKIVLLKRGMANTIEELLMSAEYIMNEGTDRIILCERGIRTFETMTRNTLDIASVVLLKQKSHLPVIVDPSHATGVRSLVSPLSRAVLAVGADGLMVETHNDPAHALCDGAQSLDLTQFHSLMEDLKKRVILEDKRM